MKIAAEKLFMTFSAADQIAILSMTDKISSLASDKIIKKCQVSANEVINQIKRVNASGTANYTAGF